MLTTSVLSSLMHGVISLSNFSNILQANSKDPDQTPHYVASDMGLHCLPMPIKTRTLAYIIYEL